MPITFTQIISNTAEVTFAWGPESVTLVYYPGKVTEETLAVLLAFEKMDENSFASTFQSLNDMLADLIKSWDAFEDDEKTIMIPITPERLIKLPLGFRMQIIRAIIGDMRPETLAPQS